MVPLIPSTLKHKLILQCTTHCKTAPCAMKDELYLP